VAPEGNIYRYVALQAERLKHCEDIWAQVDAMKHCDDANCGEDLLTTVKSNRHDASTEDGFSGFLPLEEFLSTRTWRLGPFLLPADAAMRRQHLYAVFVCSVVFLIQVTAPFFILFNQFYLLPARLKHLDPIFKGLNLRELGCLGGSRQQVMHTLMGVALLVLLQLIMRNYIHSALECVRKSQYLVLDRFWLAVGNYTNIWVTLVTTVAAPVLFWNESTPTSMSMDALTIIWLFALDDFSSYAFAMMSKSDEDFERSAAWQKALLSRCPLKLSDLRDDEGHWHLDCDAEGRLMRAGPTKELCTTRIEETQINETEILKYRVSHVDDGETLPCATSSVLIIVWSCVEKLFMMLQCIIPILWCMLDQQCIN